jgi:serine/threonine protein kinase
MTIGIVGLVRGLRFVHSRHIIHRDLKPSNSLFDNKRGIRMSDFEAGKFKCSNVARTQQPGTAPHMAPELYEDKSVILPWNAFFGSAPG